MTFEEAVNTPERRGCLSRHKRAGHESDGER